MDEEADKRKHRFVYARYLRDTTMIWDLVAAAAEQANIVFHNLQGGEAEKMRGRSKVSFKSTTKDMLQCAEDGRAKQSPCC